MRKILASLPLLLLAGAALAQSAQMVESSCGAKDFKSKIETLKEAAIPTPDASLVTIVFVEDQLVSRPGAAMCMHCDVPVLLGLNGNWIAGTQGFSHTFLSVSPGEKHFCAKVALGGMYLPAMFGLHVEAGKTYYIVGRLSIAIGSKSDILEMYQPNEDEGKFLLSSTKQTTLIAK